MRSYISLYRSIGEKKICECSGSHSGGAGGDAGVGGGGDVADGIGDVLGIFGFRKGLCDLFMLLPLNYQRLLREAREKFTTANTNGGYRCSH